jgi:hypothetical protein
LAAEDHQPRDLMRITRDLSITPCTGDARSVLDDGWPFGDLPAQYHLACLFLRVSGDRFRGD